MRTLRVSSLVLLAAIAGLVLRTGRAADPAPAAPQPAPAPFVVHEWGTFTNFSGSDGVPVNFTPDNSDLPEFVYYQAGPGDSKAARLYRDGTISMETPVVYFYTARDLTASVKVDFPRGWITEWYPFAGSPPSPEARPGPGQSVRWDVRLLAGESVRFPGNEKDARHYYRARETDAVPVQVEVAGRDAPRNGDTRGGTVVQREKFLFYRGVGTFPPPVALRAAGGGRVHVTNTAGRTVDGLVLVQVRGGKVGFEVIGSLAAGAEAAAPLPAAAASAGDVADVMVKALTAAGLYPKEARAMVNTWKHAWFGEDGNRLLYLVPRARTDELLPLTVTPKPAEVKRVFAGRYDFLTPGQEADVERLVTRARTSRSEQGAVETELRRLGRFWQQARQQAEKRLGAARR